MSNAGATRGTGAASTRNGGRAANVALWALQALLALQFAMAGLAKIFGDPAMVDMFATIGVGQWFRYLVGALEVSGAVGVLIPRLSGAAALGRRGRRGLSTDGATRTRQGASVSPGCTGTART